MTIKVGPELVDALRVSYFADVPAMVHGRHGVGKSTVFLQAAEAIGVDIIVRDLSVMEPSDLVGIPWPDGDATRFRPPSFLPRGGRGILLFEEINRCPKYMQAPCLQLLTARQVHDYVLPPGWVPMAAVNDGADGYQVDDLDAALMSRFTHIGATPDVTAWCEWAAQAGIHQAVRAFVAKTPDIFSDPVANPRAWEYASKHLKAWEAISSPKDATLAALLAGVLDDTWANAFLSTYRSNPSVPPVAQVLDDYRSVRPRMQAWRESARIDLQRSAWMTVARALEDGEQRHSILSDAARVANVNALINDLVAELQREARAWLEQRGISLGAPRRTRSAR